jgi:hypothetical protein
VLFEPIHCLFKEMVIALFAHNVVGLLFGLCIKHVISIGRRGPVMAA